MHKTSSSYDKLPAASVSARLLDCCMSENLLFQYLSAYMATEREAKWRKEAVPMPTVLFVPLSCAKDTNNGKCKVADNGLSILGACTNNAHHTYTSHWPRWPVQQPYKQRSHSSPPDLRPPCGASPLPKPLQTHSHIMFWWTVADRTMTRGTSEGIQRLQPFVCNCVHCTLSHLWRWLAFWAEVSTVP